MMELIRKCFCFFLFFSSSSFLFSLTNFENNPKMKENWLRRQPMEVHAAMTAGMITLASLYTPSNSSSFLCVCVSRHRQAPPTFQEGGAYYIRLLHHVRIRMGLE